MKNEKTKLAIFIISLFLLCLILFKYTVDLRKPWFGQLSPSHQQWQTGSTLEFTKNWYREGAWNLKFAMFENPDSIEFSSLEKRRFYQSYPPGTLLPIYALSKISGHEPTPSLVMKYNLINHFLISFFLALIIFLFLSEQLKFSRLLSFAFATIPLTFYLLLPGPLYWHQNVFFADEAIILPFVLIIFLEVLRMGSRKQLPIDLFQGLVIFYGFLTDWLVVFLAALIYLRRFSNSEITIKDRLGFLRKSTGFWFAPIAALLLFAAQLFHFNAFTALQDKFFFRAAWNSQGQERAADFFQSFWGSHISDSLGAPAIPILWASLLLLVLAIVYLMLFRKRLDTALGDRLEKIVFLTSLFIIPNFITIYLFKNHASIHKFTALKFSLTFSVVPFVLLPLLLLFLAAKNIGKSTIIVMLVFVLLFSGIYLIQIHPKYIDMFPKKSLSHAQAARFIDKNTEYSDIVFSPDLEIGVYPPQMLSLSMKRVYKVKSIAEINALISPITGDFSVNILKLSKKPTFSSDLDRLVPLAAKVSSENDFRLYKIKKEDFLKVNGLN